MEIRKKIIRDFDSGLKDQEVDYLAKRTRGLIKKDIEKVIAEYKKTATIKYQNHHPTNTCDPLTGNWTEQLIDLMQLSKTLNKSAIEHKVSFGYYINSKGGSIIKILKLMMNFFIRLSRSLGRFLSPYYMINIVVNKKQL